jgi:hypothetical protein
MLVALELGSKLGEIPQIFSSEVIAARMVAG